MLRATPLFCAASAFFMPTVTYCGTGALKMASGKIKAYNYKHPLIVTDKGILKAGLL